MASPLLPPVLHAPALEDAVVLEGVDPVLLFEGDLLEEIAPDVLVMHAIFHEAIAHLKAARQVLQDAGRLLRRRGTPLTRQDDHEESHWETTSVTRRKALASRQTVLETDSCPPSWAPDWTPSSVSCNSSRTGDLVDQRNGALAGGTSRPDKLRRASSPLASGPPAHHVPRPRWTSTHVPRFFVPPTTSPETLGPPPQGKD